MTTSEFSDAFDILLNSFNAQTQYGEQSSQREVVLDEYEKSVFLTQAQEEVVINFYNGRNSYGESFESTEELRRYLDSLVETKLYTKADAIAIVDAISDNSLFFQLPNDLAFITYEQVTFDDTTLGCYNGQTADVYPVTQDEYNRIIRNPFRGPTKRRVLRIDTGDNNVELISKFNISKYLIKYLAKPSPIILIDLTDSGLNINGESKETECKLNEILHNTILRRAVQLALTSKTINTKGNGE